MNEYKEKLDKLYFTDPQQYMDYLQKVKNAGYKVYRNGAGKHKVEFDFDGAFGGIFGDIFSGGG